MRSRNIVVIVFLMIVSLAFKAGDDDYKPMSNTKELVAKLDSMAKSLKSIKSDFIQIKHIDVLEEEIESRGKFLFLKPSNLKWSYTEPYQYEIAIIDGSFKINNDGKISEFDANSNKSFSEINKMIVSMVNGSILSNKTFSVTLLQNKRFYKAVLIPSNADFKRFISEIHVFFDKKDLMVSKIRMVEASGDYTIIKFENRKLNTGVSLSDLRIEK